MAFIEVMPVCAAGPRTEIARSVPSPIGDMRYPEVFRRSLESENRLCLGSFMSAEHDDLPAGVMREVQTFTDVNVAWLSRMLLAAGVVTADAPAEARAKAIFASIAGAQLMARSRSDIGLFDDLVGSFRETGFLPS